MGKKRAQKWPTIAEVPLGLRSINAEVSTYEDDPAFRDEYGEFPSCDVRLQVYAGGGGWDLHSGDSSYDQDHRGYWGSSSVNGRRFNSTDTARDLIKQCKEMHAQGEGRRL